MLSKCHMLPTIALIMAVLDIYGALTITHRVVSDEGRIHDRDPIGHHLHHSNILCL